MTVEHFPPLPDDPDRRRGLKDLLEEIRVNDFLDSIALTDLSDYTEWTTWTPTLTDITQGNGTVTARYAKIGKTVVCNFELVFGSTTSIDASNPGFSTPVTQASHYTEPRNTIGQGYAFDSGTAAYPLDVRLQGADEISLGVLTASGTYAAYVSITATVPFTWAVNDIIQWSAVYEAAS